MGKKFRSKKREGGEAIGDPLYLMRALTGEPFKELASSW